MDLSKATDAELLGEYLSRQGNPFDIQTDAAQENELLMELSNVDGFQQYLRNIMGQDVIRYFRGAEEQQAMTKGAFNRTASLLSKMIKIKGLPDLKKELGRRT